MISPQKANLNADRANYEAEHGEGSAAHRLVRNFWSPNKMIVLLAKMRLCSSVSISSSRYSRYLTGPARKLLRVLHWQKLQREILI